jgi:tetratricopeptide (TPR) repeat protein
MIARRTTLALALAAAGLLLAGCGSATGPAVAADNQAAAQEPEPQATQSGALPVEGEGSQAQPGAPAPVAQETANEQLEMARTAFNAGSLSAAAGAADAALAREPNNPDALLLKARILKRQGAFDAAMGLLDRAAGLLTAEEDKPRKAAVLAERLGILNARRDYVTAIKDGKSALLLDPMNVEAMREIGRGYMGLNRPGLARYVFNNALEVRPDGRIYFYLGNIANQEKDYKSALFYFTKAVETDGRLPEAFNNLALVNQAAGNHEAAVENLRKALDLRPDFARARLNLANSYRHLQRFKEAEETYREVLSASSSMAEAYFDLGVLYLENEVPGYEAESRYSLAVKNFSTYRDLMGASLAADDPALRYIKEAQTLLEQSRQMKEQMKQMEEQPPQGGAEDQPAPAEGGDAGSQAAPADEPVAPPPIQEAPPASEAPATPDDATPEPGSF